jgi:ribosomal protein S18 acetylase RimI-like enzyme
MTAEPDFTYHSVPASHYNFDQLAAIYNQTRVDYIVPMPMNGKRMEEYIRYYDVNLEASIVAFNSAQEMMGVGMLGLRGSRAWITRLGVLPERRGRKIGQYMMDTLLDRARNCQATQVQLEVIKGNDPAHQLFTKLGFVAQRELLIVRRPPRAPEAQPRVEDAVVSALTAAEIVTHLEQRQQPASWIDENQSLLNISSLGGLKVRLPSGAEGWIVFHSTPFQLSHFALEATRDCYTDVVTALLYYLHREYPNRDTKVENLPADSPAWPVFQYMGYVEAFRRYEMTLNISSISLPTT